jgi:hypothetical protein
MLIDRIYRLSLLVILFRNYMTYLSRQYMKANGKYFLPHPSQFISSFGATSSEILTATLYQRILTK